MSATLMNTQVPQNPDGWGKLLADSIRRVFPQNTAKMAARVAATTPRTTEGWLDGHLPGSAAILSMMLESEEMQAEINKIIEELREAKRG